MELKNAKCPNCGATIKVNPGATVAVCRYCESEYEVEGAIAQYNIEHQDVKEQTIQGKVNVGTQVIQHQTVINHVTRPRKFITVSKTTDVSVYKEIRYDLIDRRLVENGTKYEYVFEREDVFSNDKELMTIESKIDTDFNDLNTLLAKEQTSKATKNAGLVGLAFLLFIPFIGWIILFIVAVVAIANKAGTKSKIKKGKLKLTTEIESLKEQWLEVAFRKGLIS